MGFAFEALKIQEKKNEEPCFIYAREHFSTEYSSLWLHIFDYKHFIIYIIIR